MEGRGERPSFFAPLYLQAASGIALGAVCRAAAGCFGVGTLFIAAPWMHGSSRPLADFGYRLACTAAAIRLTAPITVSGRSSWTSWPLPCATIKLPCGERAASCCWSRIKVGSHSRK
jgi:hypothetical protein